MIRLGMYLSEKTVEMAIRSFGALPDLIRPIYFADKENAFDDRDLLSDGSRFIEFQKKNPIGYFLVSPKCLYNVSIHRKNSRQSMA